LSITSTLFRLCGLDLRFPSVTILLHDSVVFVACNYYNLVTRSESKSNFRSFEGHFFTCVKFFHLCQIFSPRSNFFTCVKVAAPAYPHSCLFLWSKYCSAFSVERILCHSGSFWVVNCNKRLFWGVLHFSFVNQLKPFNQDWICSNQNMFQYLKCFKINRNFN
jgi:hypothetical protein